MAASKLRLPLAHIEAGERSFNKAMPEEINRVVADHVADLLLCISPNAVDNLAAEGLTRGVHWVGDVMLDAVMQMAPLAAKHSTILADVGVHPGAYVLCTVHRAANTDDPVRLRQIVIALNALHETVVFPVHPRARRALDELDLHFEPHVRTLPAIGYLDMLALEQSADAIVTDSGGVTREAYFLGVRCITLREETEHVGTVRAGWNVLAGTTPDRILEAVRDFRPETARPPLFGHGCAASSIVDFLEESATCAREVGMEHASQAPLAATRV